MDEIEVRSYPADVMEKFIFSTTGDPFKTLQAAKSAISKGGLDPETHQVVAFLQDGGEKAYAVQKVDPGTLTPAQAEDTYWLVRFSAKASPDDFDDVQLFCNGDTLLVQRRKEVIVPVRFLECADHATYTKFIQLPNEPRKRGATIQTFPYTVIRQATRAEYLKMKKEGDATSRRNLKLYGPNYVPDDDDAEIEDHSPVRKGYMPSPMTEM